MRAILDHELTGPGIILEGDSELFAACDAVAYANRYIPSLKDTFLLEEAFFLQSLHEVIQTRRGQDSMDEHDHFVSDTEGARAALMCIQSVAKIHPEMLVKEQTQGMIRSYNQSLIS